MKLNIPDISIVGEGMQVKTLIKSKYGTLEDFLKAHPIYTINTLKWYLKMRNVDNPDFKIKMVTALDMDYHDIYITPDKQLIKFIDTMENEIELYDNETDLHTVDTLIDLAYGIDKELLNNCYYLKALVYVNIGQSDNAINCLNISKQKASLYNKSICEIGFCHFIEKQYQDAERCYSELLYNTKSGDYLLYYRCGLLYNNIGKNIEAANMFQKAINITDNKKLKGKALMNISIANRRIANFDEAINISISAIEYFDDKHNKGIVYNNIASIYMHMNDNTNAYKYAKLSLDNLDINKCEAYLVAIKTLAQIEIKIQGMTTRICDLISYICKLENRASYKKYINESVEFILIYANDTELIALEKILKKMLLKKSYLYDILIKKGMI